MADLLPASLMPSVLLSVASTSPLMSTDAASSPTHNLSLHDALPISAAAPQDCRQHWRPLKPALASRSEERRVGKECRSRRSPHDVEHNKEEEEGESPRTRSDSTRSMSTDVSQNARIVSTLGMIVTYD